MTDQERRELRDLDKWSAKFMGYTDISYTGRTLDGHREYHVRDKEGVLFPWCPLVNLNQAFLVVEKMRELGWFLELKYFGSPPGSWRAMWSRFSLEKPNFVYAFDDNPALVILKAAKAALAGEGGIKGGDA